jgi:mRNA-degrading endonuclease RelE of RelBE toxin-antitoxin system
MKILYSKTSLKYLQGLDKKIRKRIFFGIEKLPNKGDVKKMKGQKLKNIYRLRIGKYRIIFLQEKEWIKVLDIDTRGDVYK